MSSDDIIAKVKEHPELWQTSHPFYRHRVAGAKTWKKIAEELQADEIMVRKRWKHLKDQYRKEHKKVIANIIPLSYWHFYNDLNFLNDDIMRTNLKSAADAEARDSDKKSNNSDSDDAPLQAKRSRKHATEESSPKRTLLKTQEMTGTHSLITRNGETGKLNLILNRLHAMEEAMDNKNNATENAKKKDSDFMFLLSLLPIMKKLKDIQKLQFRGKINDWLLDIVTENENRSKCNESRGTDWNVIRKQWKHLKDTFRKEMKKLATKQLTTSNWRYYNDLQFVADEVGRKHEKQESEYTETESESPTQEQKIPLKTKILRKRNRLVPTPTSVETTSQNFKKFKRIMRSLNTLSKCMEKSSNFFDDDFKNDADYMFLVSLLPTLKNLSDVQRLNFRGKINDWLLNALIENKSSAECDTKSYVQEQIKNANVQDYKVEFEDNS